MMRLSLISPLLSLLLLPLLLPATALPFRYLFHSPSPLSSPSPSSLPFGPRTLGILEGFNSLPHYSDPATRTDGFSQWLGWRPSFAGQCLDFSHFSTDPSFFISAFLSNATHATIALQMPAMFPPPLNTTWEAAATGQYNTQWYQTADHLCNTLHKCNTLMRVMWEMNGNWYPWSAALNLTAYLAYFKHIVHTVRSVPHQQFKIVWNPNAMYQYGTPHTLNPPWLAYPGDDYVDVIALDLYDQDWSVYQPDWQVNKTQQEIEGVWTAQWEVYQKGLYGLDDFLEFAIEHKKPLALAEWGLKPTASHGGGDNVIYVQNMYQWLTSSKVQNQLLYQAWYDEEDSTISREPINPKNSNFPKSAQLYKAMFGPSNPFWSTVEAVRE